MNDWQNDSKHFTFLSKSTIEIFFSVFILISIENAPKKGKFHYWFVSFRSIFFFFTSLCAFFPFIRSVDHVDASVYDFVCVHVSNVFDYSYRKSHQKFLYSLESERESERVSVNDRQKLYGLILKRESKIKTLCMCTC